MNKILKILAIMSLASLLVVASVGCAAAALQSIKASPSTVSLAKNATQQLNLGSRFGCGRRPSSLEDSSALYVVGRQAMLVVYLGSPSPF